jgi:hypothetical protein
MSPHPDRLTTLPYATPAAPVDHFRWVICGLLFLATAINYKDRCSFA